MAGMRAGFYTGKSPCIITQALAAIAELVTVVPRGMKSFQQEQAVQGILDYENKPPAKKEDISRAFSPPRPKSSSITSQSCP